MKPIIRNVLFCTLILPCVNTLLQAQSQSTAPPPAGRTTEVGRLLPAIATSVQGHRYDYADHQINAADLKSKEVSKEITISKNAEIYIENSSRGIVLKTWDQQKVKVTTTVYFEGENKLTDDEWLEKVNLSLKTLGTSVKIKSGTVSGGSFYAYEGGTLTGSMNGGGVAVFNSTGQNIGTKSNMKRLVTITVPADSKLDIESKYAEVQLPANMGEINVDIINGSLEADNINKLILRSRYSNVNIGDVKIAEIEFINGRFSAKNIDELDIDSKYSSIEMASAKKVVFRSINDEYELEEAGEVSGRKNYGNLRITKLNNSLEVEGSNADIKVRNIASSVNLIKIDDKYADIRIPLKNTKNYSVDFAGGYSSVYGNFEKKALAANDADKKSSIIAVRTLTTTNAGNAIPMIVDTAVAIGHSRLSGNLIATNIPSVRNVNLLRNYSYLNSNGTPSKFTATVGDGKGLKIDIRCQNCTVDFK